MAASDAAKSISGILFVDDDMMKATLTIIFDDAKTDIGKIKAEMKKVGFPVEGEPEVLK
jgi:copper chaperone CopZ